MLVPVTIAVAPAAPPSAPPAFTLLAVFAALLLILCGRRVSAFCRGGPTVLLLLLALALLLPPWLVPLTLLAFLVGSRTTPMPLLLSGIGTALAALMRWPLPTTVASAAIALVPALPAARPAILRSRAACRG
ncbi:MAG: hypothetical protein ACRET6_10005, partial [Burkholderiales bacterium]